MKMTLPTCSLCFALLFWWIISAPLFAQVPNFNLEHLTSKEGLSHNSINEAIQDSKGFIWLATDGGLNRYDGQTFKVYEQDADNPNAISSNYCRTLLEDRQGNIWIGTNYGINRLDPTTETIRTYFFETPFGFEGANFVHCLYEDAFGFIWYGTYYGTMRLQPETGHIDVFLSDKDDPQSLPNDVIWKIVEDEQGNVWFGSQRGLALLTPENLEQQIWEFDVYRTDPDDPDALHLSGVWAIVRDSTNQMWLGGRNGIVRVHRDSTQKLTFKHWQHDPDRPNSLSYNFIEDLHVDPQNRIWVATYAKGMDLIRKNPENPGELSFVNFQNELANPTSLPNNNVHTLFTDNNHVLWIGSPNGLSKLDPHTRHFDQIAFLENEPYSLSDNAITCLFEDRRQNLWVGTQSGGVNVHFRASEKPLGRDFIVFQHDRLASGSLSHNQISCIFEDSEGYIWIATYDGLNYIAPEQLNNPNAFQVLHVADGLPHKWILDIYQDQAGDYWLSSYGGYARMRFDPNQPDQAPEIFEFKMDENNPNSLSNATTYHTERDRFGNLWIGSFNGLNRLQTANQDSIWFDCYYVERDHPSSLATNAINRLFRDSKDRLWALTASGLHAIHIEAADQRATFQVFNRKAGLPSANVVSILEDEEGLFWIATNKGIALFDPDRALDKSTDELPVLRVFNPQDGLQGDQFNRNAAVKDYQGNLLFGGQNGFNVIDPRQIPSNPFEPPVVFTDFKLFNRSVNPGSPEYNPKTSPLLRSIAYSDSVVLNFRQNDFSVEFAALSFTQSNQNTFAYKLEGFHRDWIENGSSNQAAFTNLDNGAYRLLVRAANNDGRWNETPAVLYIRILPPPWESPWAYAAYALLLSLLLYGFVRFRVKKRVAEVEAAAALEKARVEERERIRKKNAADFHDELGHKLTKIGLFLGLAQRAKASENHKMADYLAQTEKYVNQLSGGIRDFIWVLDPNKDSLLDTFSRLQAFGDQLFDYTDIRFKANNQIKDYDAIKLDLDQRRQIVLIFKEAMNNALKYSKSQHAILSCTKTGNNIELQFSDDGVGFDLNRLNGKGYGLKNLNMRAEKIDALLHIDSAPEQGTQIRLRLPIPHMG
ncbi:MAG: two-component regulator propeller domain-containing protein [Bacteroidota bacterium]